MPHVVEASMHHLLWQWLSSSLGYDVAGEVNIGNGKIDLLAESPEGLYVGYEVKDQNKLMEDPSNVNSLIHQLNKYAQSGYLDRLYFCSQEPLSMSNSLHPDNWRVDISSLNEEFTLSNIPQHLDNDHVISPPDGLGFVKVPWENRDEELIGIEQRASALSTQRTKTPELPRQNEGWVKHHAWQEIRNDEWDQCGGIFEGVLPDSNGRNTRRIDIVGFYGSPIPGDILRNQKKEKFDMIGVEAKGAELGSSSVHDVRKQVLAYIQSKTLTQVYLSVPAGDENLALEVLDESNQTSLTDHFEFSAGPDVESTSVLGNVGIMAVDEEGDVEYVRMADELDMQYDGFINAEFGPDTPVMAGWGLSVGKPTSEQLESVYNQLGERDIYRKAQAIDTECVRELFSRNEYRRIFQLRQKVLGGGELNDAERFFFDKVYRKCGDKI